MNSSRKLGGRGSLGARRIGAPRPIAALLPRATAAARRGRGIGEAPMILDWPNIVGDEIAADCIPERLMRGPQGGVLYLRVRGVAALRVQHMAPQLIERINTYFGKRAVASLALRQGDLPAPKRAPKAKPALSEAAIAAAEATLRHVHDDALRRALARLAAARRS
jgi:hypothetical protein